MLPLWPVNSSLWRLASEVHDNFVEEIGWPELTCATAEIYAGVPEAERARTGILTANYGEAGAINLYGPAYGLPAAISGINSMWLRGYGDPPPERLILLGFPGTWARQHLEGCEEAGRITNDYGVLNEETSGNSTIYLCGPPRLPWPEFWAMMRSFG
jgi:hypothetical protein